MFVLKYSSAKKVNLHTLSAYTALPFKSNSKTIRRGRDMRREVINLPIFGVVIDNVPSDITSATIKSNLTDIGEGGELLEALILSQFQSGIDINTPAYWESIETLYGVLSNKLKPQISTTTSEKVIIERERTVIGLVNEITIYEVDTTAWPNHLSQNNEAETESSLQELISIGHAIRVDHNNELVAVIDEKKCGTARVL